MLIHRHRGQHRQGEARSKRVGECAAGVAPRRVLIPDVHSCQRQTQRRHSRCKGSAGPAGGCCRCGGGAPGGCCLERAPADTQPRRLGFGQPATQRVHSSHHQRSLCGSRDDGKRHRTLCEATQHVRRCNALAPPPTAARTRLGQARLAGRRGPGTARWAPVPGGSRAPSGRVFLSLQPARPAARPAPQTLRDAGAGCGVQRRLRERQPHGERGVRDARAGLHSAG